MEGYKYRTYKGGIWVQGYRLQRKEMSHRHGTREIHSMEDGDAWCVTVIELDLNVRNIG